MTAHSCEDERLCCYRCGVNYCCVCEGGADDLPESCEWSGSELCDSCWDIEHEKAEEEARTACDVCQLVSCRCDEAYERMADERMGVGR